MLHPYSEYLDRRWHEGCRNAALLWRELVARGFSGRPGAVREWTGPRRKSEASRTRAPNRADQLLSSRQVTRLLMADHNLLGENVKSKDAIGITFPGNKSMGAKTNLKLRFDSSFMQMAADGKL